MSNFFGNFSGRSPRVSKGGFKEKAESSGSRQSELSLHADSCFVPTADCFPPLLTRGLPLRLFDYENKSPESISKFRAFIFIKQLCAYLHLE
jgi:hypothetical protein